MIGDEEKYTVLVNGILTPVPESQLTDEQLTYLFDNLKREVNKYPLIVRSALAELIFKQHGVEVFAPGEPLKLSRKQKRNMKVVKIKNESNVEIQKKNIKGNIL